MSNFWVLCTTRCLEVHSSWLFTSELANQHEPKAVFTCVVYANNNNCHSSAFHSNSVQKKLLLQK